jgi:hypothetical protein
LIDQLRRSEALGRDCKAWNALEIVPSSKAQRFGDAIVQCSLDQKEMLLAYMHFLYSIPMVVKLNPTSTTKLIHPETLGTSQNSGLEFYHFEDEKKLKLEFITRYKEVASKIPDLSNFELSFSDMLKFHAREASLKFLRIIESIEKE